MRAKHFIQVAVVMVVAAGLGLSTTHAATISVATGDQWDFSVSNSDLINVGQSTLQSIAITEGSLYPGCGSLDYLNDGIVDYGPDNYAGNAGSSFIPMNNTVVTVALNTSASPLGYRIDSIVTLVGSCQTNRNGQKFDLWYSLVGNPDSFVYVAGDAEATVDYPNGVAIEVQSTITGSSPIATGVAKLKFKFYDRSTECLYRGLDVFGAPVPEPSTLALLATGLIGLLCYAWRKRK